MSQVFVCSCGRKTTEPFIIRGHSVCVICAEDEAPDIVTRREKTNLRKFRDPKVPTRRYGVGRD